MDDELIGAWKFGPGRLAAVVEAMNNLPQMEQRARQHFRGIRAQMRHADRGRSPLKPDLKFHIPGVLVDSAIGARAVDYDGRIGNVPGLQAREAAVARDLVLQHELENQVTVELQPLLYDHPNQTKTNGDAGLVVHGAAAED